MPLAVADDDTTPNVFILDEVDFLPFRRERDGALFVGKRDESTPALTIVDYDEFSLARRGGTVGLHVPGADSHRINVVVYDKPQSGDHVRWALPQLLRDAVKRTNGNKRNRTLSKPMEARFAGWEHFMKRPDLPLPLRSKPYLAQALYPDIRANG